MGLREDITHMPFTSQLSSRICTAPSLPVPVGPWGQGGCGRGIVTEHLRTCSSAQGAPRVLVAESWVLDLLQVTARGADAVSKDGF